MPAPKLQSRVTNYAGKFIKYETLTWTDATGKERLWETVERARELPAVMMIPFFKPSNTLLLVREYRPPVDNLVIEFPAGLMEKGETPAVAAIREMQEETGYACRVVEVLPPTCNTPGLSSEANYQVWVEIDDDAPCAPQPDEGEFIENIVLPRADIAAFIRRELEKNSVFDSRVMAFLRGMLAGRQEQS
ncbi:MAG: NUDIX hydrolase [Planctomycetota bacterium]|jgi:8-oxo-dGTP pyrophosphatase MutT (NUDIX family)|nr:NUDIX hydrolase [Planctomycetota bacterium]